MATTLTREAILQKTQTRYEEVEIEGWGTVGIRSVTKLRASQRASRLFNDDGSKSDTWDKREAHRIIDQLMSDENTPMFKEKDVDLLLGLDDASLEPLMQAISEFNGDVKKKGLKRSSESSDETTS